MSNFLIAIPKGNRNTQIFNENIIKLQKILREVGQIYSTEFLGENYAHHVIESPTSDKSVIILHWAREGQEKQYKVDGDHWAISAGHNVTTGIINNMIRRGGVLRYKKPVWGHYCTVYGDRYMDQLVAWNTTPALEAIHYAENEYAVFISNKPFLIAIALSGGSKNVALSEAFITEYLLFGYSVTGNTAFEGVKTLDVNNSLRVQKGHVFIDSIPSGLSVDLPVEQTLEETAKYLVDALRNSMQRSLDHLNGLPLELRMSGGKDSRILLGLLKDTNYPVRGVTFGVEGESETIAAQILCDMADIPLDIRAPKKVEGITDAEKLSNTIKNSDGIPPSEAHTGVYIGAERINNQDQGIMLGQWPLMKGGMARKMRYSKEEVERVIFRQASNFVNAEHRASYIEYLQGWLDNTAFTSLLDILYLFARNFRSGRWLHGHAHLYSKQSLLVYPLADMEVCAVSDAISNVYRVSEKAYFMALKEIWLEALNLPLSGNSKWRFEQFAKDAEISGDGFELRNQSFAENVVMRKGQSRRRLVRELSEQINQHPNKNDIWDKLTEEMKEFITQAAKGNIIISEGLTMREVIKNLWRILAAEVWYSKSWL